MTHLKDSRLTNLPIALSTFIGREREIAEVTQLLSNRRLFTLTGPGGCGKSRLAFKVAGEMLSSFTDGVWLVEFAPLADPALVPQAITSTLGLREQVGYSLTQTLTEFLHTRHILLVLDNCEHLIAACAQLSAGLLQSCPEIKIFATSREPLSVPGEAVWVVPPLSLPDPQPWRSPEAEDETLSAYRQSEAVQLFADRATAAASDFALKVENAAWVAEICRRLDGIPLAIELAAARVRAMSVRQIAEYLDDRFRLLTSDSRVVPPRHQTLEATLDWSYALLSDGERKVLQRLSVFAGGWSLEAAGEVCAGAPEEAGKDIEASQVLDALLHMVDKSLIVVKKAESEMRYSLLETIRQYARERLAESDEEAKTRDRHLNWFLEWFEQGERNLYGPDQLAWLRRFELEHDNLRAALEWSRSAKDRAILGLRLAGAAGRFWRLRGYLHEGRTRLSDALAHADKLNLTAPSERAWALLRASSLAYLQCDYKATRRYCEECLPLFEGLGTAGLAGFAIALTTLGETATEEGDYVTAPAKYYEALAIWRELKDVRGIADALMQLGWAAMRVGDYPEAAIRLEESLALIRETNFTEHIALNLSGLGEAAVRMGQYERASRFLKESLALRRDLGDKWGIGTSLGTIGWAALRQGNFQRAHEALNESLLVRTEIGDPGGMAWCLEKLAESTSLQGYAALPAQRSRYLQKSVHLYAAAASLRAPIGSVVDPADQPEYNRNLSGLRASLGTKAFDKTWSEGSSMPIQEVVVYALVVPESLPTGGASPSPRDLKAIYGGLSPREREIASLIALGKSNREIAKIMVVRVKTVETYVTRILNKLDYDSRVQIATWAVEKGLKASSPDHPE